MTPTVELARFVATSRLADIPDSVQHEAERAILNWLGCAMGGASEPAVETALHALEPFFGQPQATFIGRGGQADILSVALVQGLASNILDFDDTHLETVIHPSVPLLSALFPLAEARGVTGADFLHAYVLGVEVACRAGLAGTAAHCEGGWHSTATCGVLGAAAACGKLLGLDERRMAWAIGIAATQASGLVEMLGSQSKSMNMGFAARNGLMAALLAEREFTSSERALEAPRGFLQVLGGSPDVAALTRDLGRTWELERNAYKPFPCGIVLHPIIDGCLQLRREHNLRPGDILRVRLRVNPLVQVLTGRREPKDGLEGKLSVFHSAAVALVDGAAGVRQYTDERVRNGRVVALRSRIEMTVDEQVAKDEAWVAVDLTNARSYERHVRCAIGSLDRPLTDDDLAEKFRELASDLLATSQTERLLGLAWNIRALGDVGSIARGSVPEELEVLDAETPGAHLVRL
jgi:2-methylcitrate dehydratase PrpD